MKKIIAISFPLFLFVVILLLTQIVVSNMLSTTGVKLDSLQSDIIKYHKANTHLREKVLSDTSFRNVASSAAEMGFIDVKTNVYISNQLPITRR